MKKREVQAQYSEVFKDKQVMNSLSYRSKVKTGAYANLDLMELLKNQEIYLKIPWTDCAPQRVRMRPNLH